jgi:hypothetical protein
MKRWLRSEWPGTTALGLWIAYLACQLLAMRGAVSFASDDAYMRLAIGRSLAETGTWGINPGQFASAVGTLFWPMLLAAVDLVVGAHKSNPLAINAILSCFLIVSFDRAARRVVTEPWLRLAAVILAVVILPLAPLVLEGMEHTLQLLLTTMFLEGMLRVLDQERRGWICLVIAALLLPATRYEGVFVLLLVAIALGFSSRKHIPLTALMFVAGILPLVVYGWISYHNGWLPVPNDVYFRRAPLIPDTLAGLLPILLRPLDLLNQDAALRALVLAPLIGAVWGAAAKAQTEAKQRAGMRMVLLLGAVLLHLLFIGVRQSRYDAYLILIGWWAVLPWLQAVVDVLRLEKLAYRSVTGAAFALLGILLFFPLLNRGVSETIGWWQARADFRGLQQAAVSVLKHEAPRSAVLTDFPGVVAYSGFRVIDLSGMGSAELARARRAGGVHTEDIANEVAVHQITIATVFDPAMRENLPGTWLLSRSIKIPGADGNDQDILFYDIR